MASAKPTLDLHRFAILRELDDGDGEFIATVVNEFESDAHRQAAAMMQAVADGAAPDLERAAHALKGAAANLGAESLADICEHLQNMVRAGNLDGSAELVVGVEPELDRVLDALAQVLAGV